MTTVRVQGPEGSQSLELSADATVGDLKDAIADKLGIPFVDKPVSVDLLAKAMLNGMESESEAGIFDYTGMERLADMRR